MDLGPGTKPEDYLYLDDKWGIRAVPTSGRVFFYVDGPFDGVDDGSINDIMFPWARFRQEGKPNFMLGDYWGVPEAWKDCKVFKQSCHKDSPYTPFFYAVMFDHEPKPISEAKYHAGFHGYLNSHPCRQQIPAALDYSRCYLRATDKLYWSHTEDEQKEMRQAYLSLMDDTKFVLCPRGKGLNSIRFFEALRMGRIPVLISDNAKLPMDSFVDWDEIIVRVPEDDVASLMDRIESWPQDHEVASIMARKLSMEYFSNVNKYVQWCGVLSACNDYNAVVAEQPV